MAPATATAVTAKPAKQPKPLPAPNSDFYEVYETLNPEELATVKRVRTFMEAKVAPVITKYWVDDAFPFELLSAVLFHARHRRQPLLRASGAVPKAEERAAAAE
jgi:hypothetical protein